RLDRCGAEPDLVALCKRCLAFRQEDRLADAGAIAAEVAHIRQAAEERARDAELERERQRGKAAEERRGRGLWMGLAAALLAVVTISAAGGLYWQGQLAQRRIEESRSRQDLQLAQDMIGQNRLRDAREPLARVEARQRPGGAEDLREEFQRIYSGWQLATALEQIQHRSIAVAFRGGAERGLSEVRPYDNHMTLVEYEKSFAGKGMHIFGGDFEELAATIRNSPVKVAILSALDNWSLVCSYHIRLDWGRRDELKSKRDRLLELARAVDPDPELRDLIRDPRLWADRSKLIALAQEAERIELPSTLTALLAEILQSASIDAERLLRATLDRHPDDFWINYQLGRVLGEKFQERRARGMRIEAESLRYFQATLALRPGNSMILTAIGTALAEDESTRLQAAEYLLRAIQADASNATAYNNLGTVYRDQGKHAEAGKNFRLALDIDTRHPLAHAN